MPTPYKTLVYFGLSGAVAAFSFWAGRVSVKFPGATDAAKTMGHAASSTGFAAGPLASSTTKDATLDSLLKGGAHLDTDLLKRWAMGLTPQECVSALNTLQALPAGQPHDSILRAIVNAWAQQDPKGYLAAANSVSLARLRETGVATALRSLGTSNPQDALDWIKQNSADSSGNDLSKRYASAIGGFASTDPAGALGLASGLPEDSRAAQQLKTHAMEAIADSLADQGNFQSGIALFTQMAAGKYQNDALSQLADRWGQVAPQDAATWIATQSDPAVRNDMGQNLTDSWANADPLAAANWAAQIDQQALAASSSGNGNNSGDMLLEHVISAWGHSDLNAAGTYLNSLAPSASKDSATASFAKIAAQDNAASAMQWANTIQDPQLQQKTIQQVAKQWQRQDPAGYAQYTNSGNAAVPATPQN